MDVAPGGDIPEPTYQQVCAGSTGHAEAYQFEYDPSKVDYADLVSPPPGLLFPVVSPSCILHIVLSKVFPSGSTGHAEAYQFEYDPSEVDYADLVSHSSPPCLAITHTFSIVSHHHVCRNTEVVEVVFLVGLLHPTTCFIKQQHSKNTSQPKD